MGREKGFGKKLSCLECQHCKTRVFTTATELKDWCDKQGIKPRPGWIDNVVEYQWWRLMWCEVQIDYLHFSPRSTNPKHTANILEIIRTDQSKIIVTNHETGTFIPDCRKYMVR